MARDLNEERAFDRDLKDRDLKRHDFTDEESAQYADQPFAAGPDLVLQQVGWRDAVSGALFRLGERVPVERAPRMHVKAVYEVNGNHYRDPSPDAAT